ncbi:hypothetical protein [Pyruvatibacter mobilis]|uniref:hypothetical protein n=1 Tax=Pyruvatibacter mobilis TaxID=1712261 RepID=UPI003D0E2E83
MRNIPETQPAGTAATAPRPAAETAYLDALPFAPRLLVWAARAWWSDRGNDEGSRRLISQAFTLARCPGADAAFDELMLMALHGACRHLDFASHPRRVAVDELALLRVIAAFQEEAVAGGEAALDTWLPPATARLACDAALTLARQMGRAGLYVHHHTRQ